MTARLFAEVREKARRLKAEMHALYLAARHPATPWYAKLLVAGIVAYALSPIDLIPDFIPVLGYLDDLILIPLALSLAIRLVPPAVLDECRARVRAAAPDGRPASRAAAVAIVTIWLAAAMALVAWLLGA